MDILRARFGAGSHVVVSIRNEKISFRAKAAKKKKKEEKVPVSAT